MQLPTYKSRFLFHFWLVTLSLTVFVVWFVWNLYVSVAIISARSAARYKRWIQNNPEELLLVCVTVTVTSVSPVLQKPPSEVAGQVLGAVAAGWRDWRAAVGAIKEFVQLAAKCDWYTKCSHFAMRT